MSTAMFHYEAFDSFSPYVGLGPYCAADYWQLPEGEPVELIDGRFVVSPSPVAIHQFIASLLTEKFTAIARQNGGMSLPAPMDVVLSDETIVQPDLLYVSKERLGIIKQRIEGPPDLVVEIISGTSRRDRIQKLALYARFGVPEYWIVDPASQVMEFLVNEGERYAIQSPAGDCYRSPRLPEVEIQLAEFWREVAERMPPQ